MRKLFSSERTITLMYIFSVDPVGTGCLKDIFRELVPADGDTDLRIPEKDKGI